MPGELKGYLEAHITFGKLPWKSIVQPTVDLCEKGYNISKALHSSIVMKKHLVEKDANLR